MIAMQKGFTLIEAIITVAIIGILATLAVNYYDEQKRRGYRQEAISALTEMSVRQERWYSQNGQYTNNMANLYRATTTTNGKYNLSATLTSTDDYTLSAIATGQQVEDEFCYEFRLDHLGTKSSYKQDGTITSSQLPADKANFRNCWSR